MSAESGKLLVRSLPSGVTNMSPAHPRFELLRAVLGGDLHLVKSICFAPSFETASLIEPLESGGCNLLHVAAISNRPEVMGALLDAVERPHALSTEALRTAARKEAVEASKSSSSKGSSTGHLLRTYDRLNLLACEQSYLDYLSVKDSRGRNCLHYGASARGVMVEYILSYRKDRFDATVSPSSSSGSGADGMEGGGGGGAGGGRHHHLLFPREAWVNPTSGELWVPPSASSYPFSPGATTRSGAGGGGSDAPGSPGGFGATSKSVGSYFPADSSSSSAAPSVPAGFVPVATIVRSRRDPAFVDARDCSSATPLHYATVSSDVRSIRSLLAHGADPFAVTVDGLTALDLSSNRVVREALVPMAAAVESACGGGGGGHSGKASSGRRASPVKGAVAKLMQGHHGSSSGIAALSKTLAASMMVGDDEGPDSAEASRARAEASLLLLVNSGEDVNGRAGLHLRSALHTAVENGALDVVELLLHSGASVDVVDVNGATPLHLAAEACSPVHQEIVRLLVDAGADVNATSSLRKTPLMYAATGPGSGAAGGAGGGKHHQHGSPSGTTTGGAATETGTSFGGTSAHVTAVSSGPRSADLNAIGGGKDGGAESSPYVVEDGGRGMVTLLVSLGANIEAVDAEGNTALIAAAKKGNHFTVDTLLALGANLYAHNRHLQTALHVAAFAHHIPVVRQLCRYDCEFGRLKYQLDSSGRSAYDVAADSNTRASLDTLLESCASGRLDLAQSVAAFAATLPPGTAAPWLPMRVTDVSRILRRSCLHATITGAAKAMAKWRKTNGVYAAVAVTPGVAAGGGGGAAGGKRGGTGGGAVGATADPTKPTHTWDGWKIAPSSVHTVAGIGMRYVQGKPWGTGGAPAPPHAAGGISAGPLSKMAWGGSQSDVDRTFWLPKDLETATLVADSYAYVAPLEKAPEGAGGSKSKTPGFGGDDRDAASGQQSQVSDLAGRRLVPGSELTSADCEKAYGRVVEFLLRSGCPIDCQDIDGVTPLMLAARYGLLYLVRKLLLKGANPSLSDTAGNTAIHYAFAFCHLTAAKILEEFSTEEIFSQRNASGRTPLEVAALGLRILQDSSEQLLVIRPPPNKSATLVVSTAL